MTKITCRIVGRGKIVFVKLKPEHINPFGNGATLFAFICTFGKPNNVKCCFYIRYHEVRF